MPAQATQHVIRETILDAKGLDVRILDVRKVTDFTDYMIIASGTSNRHVISMGDRIIDALRAHNRRPIGIEGQDPGDWVLIDFGDVVVHLMRPQTRDFYNLEKLWSDAADASQAER